MRPTNQPPTYIPATPVQQPDTSGMMMGALLGAAAQGLGGLAGAWNARQPNGATRAHYLRLLLHNQGELNATTR